MRNNSIFAGMALDLKTLLTRTISAVVFVALLLGCVLWNYYSFTAFFFIIAMLGLNEFYKIAEKLQAKPFKLTGFISAIITYFSFVKFPLFNANASVAVLCNAFLVICPFVILSVGLFSKKEDSIKNTFFTIGGIVYAVLPFALLNKTVFFTNELDTEVFAPKFILGIIFLIWINDTFAYLGGSLIGKHKLIKRISPGKTWEGTIIGVLISFALSFLFNRLFPLSNYTWPILGICIPILATIGDLVESKIKREAEIKDSGTLMPGHGGVLDRFDSLIFVSPFVFALFKLYSLME